MSIETELQNVVAAASALNQTVRGQIDQINANVGNAIANNDARTTNAIHGMNATVNSYVANARGQYPLPQNLVKNAYMDVVDNGVPTGYVAAGLALSAVHPWTKGFEGPYTHDRPSAAVDDSHLATIDNPYWFGTYTKGPRFPVWGGGLADGWYGLGSGHLLKVTAAATVPEDTRWLFLPAQRRVYAEAYGFRMWVHIARGSAVGIGSHAGYMTSDPGGGIVVTKAECDAQPQGWKLVEGVVGISAMMTTFGNGFSIGFSSTEEVEAYIAMPYVYAFLHPGNAGMSMGD
jgi:hypothetical protein